MGFQVHSKKICYHIEINALFHGGRQVDWKILDSYPLHGQKFSTPMFQVDFRR
jgi:hypothetical protein